MGEPLGYPQLVPGPLAVSLAPQQGKIHMTEWHPDLHLVVSQSTHDLYGDIPDQADPARSGRQIHGSIAAGEIEDTDSQLCHESWKDRIDSGVERKIILGKGDVFS